MSQGDKVVIFTFSFPYGEGEHFIESELPVLASRFREVVVVPFCGGGGGTRTELPDNVRVLEPLLESNSKVRRLAKGVFNFSPIVPFALDVLRNGLFLRPRALKRELGAAFLARYLLSHRTVRELVFAEKNILYFYWSVGAAYFVPFGKPKGPAVVRFHGTDLYEERECNRGYIPFRKQLAACGAKLVFVSRQGLEYFVSRYPAAKDRSRVFRLGVFDRGKSTRSKDGTLRIVSCSNAVPLKRIDLIIEALTQCRREVEWTHIGDGPELESLQAKASGLPANVRAIFAGRLSNKAVMEFYRRNPVDLFVNVSESEGLPVSIMESLSFGVPVLATDVGGTSELVSDDVGRLLPADLSAADLAGEIERFYAGHYSGTELREAARRRWKERADAEKNYNEFCDFLESLDR